MQIINVCGGYWTGSSAAISLLEEHEKVFAIAEEYSAFGYGELFHNLKDNNTNKIANSKIIFEEFNKPENYKFFRSLLRFCLRKLMIFPKFIFIPKINGIKLFGSNYENFCKNDYTKLFSQKRSAQKESLKIFYNSIKSDYNDKNLDLLIMDQMISPSFIKDFNLLNNNIKHIIIDRNWKDQYAEIRNKLVPLVAKNIAIDVNPLNEGISNLGAPQEMFLTIRKKFNKDLIELKKQENVLVLNFEDIINRKLYIKNKIFDFLEVNKGNWNEYTLFDERVSKKNINKWKELNIENEINFIEKRL
jgi:hypothetical protein